MSTIERMRAILFRVVAWPGGRDELLAFLQRDAHESGTEGGTLRFDVVEDPQNDHAFFVYELYRDDPAFTVHKKNAAFREWQERIQPQLASFSILSDGEPKAVLFRNDGRGYDTKALQSKRDAIAPDGSDVRVLLELGAGAMAHFELAPNQVSQAVTHRTVEEIWFFVRGRGQMWRKQATRTSIVDVSPGVCLTIPLGTHFQFRAIGDEALAAVGVTMPPWPGEGEAVLVVGEWNPTIITTKTVS